jgi:cell division FtsZ-interacting protein ZapD
MYTYEKKIKRLMTDIVPMHNALINFVEAIFVSGNTALQVILWMFYQKNKINQWLIFMNKK